MEKNLISSCRIGIFGGAFDPLHIGHYIIANVVLDELKLEKLFIVPTFISPFKYRQGDNDADFRFNMLEKVFKSNHRIEISDYEINKKQISYSINTINYFHDRFNVSPYFIIGEDNFISIKKWKNSKEIIEKVKFAVYPRRIENENIKNADNKEIIEHIDICAPKIDISSTMIRERIYNNKTIDGMVPDKILDEVREHYGK